MTELEANQSILLHGGPQSSRRAVLLLNKLGKAHQVSCSFESSLSILKHFLMTIEMLSYMDKSYICVQPVTF